jgi:hypothetical protein
MAAFVVTGALGDDATWLLKRAPASLPHALCDVRATHPHYPG